MPSSTATSMTSWWTSFSILFCALSANIRVNMKRPTVYLTTSFRSNVVAIIRGVICALAT